MGLFLSRSEEEHIFIIIYIITESNELRLFQMIRFSISSSSAYSKALQNLFAQTHIICFVRKANKFISQTCLLSTSLKDIKLKVCYTWDDLNKLNTQRVLYKELFLRAFFVWDECETIAFVIQMIHSERIR